MTITSFFGLLGGLALFLYGMQMMSEGLEAAAGNRMKQILEKLTANRFLGVLMGALITAVIQSSSATTVMVVGFVNTGLMTLHQAVWIIMGANIGTTITGQLIALDVGMLAPLFAFAGVAMIVFLKSPRLHHVGKILAGLGVLFIGMDMMGAAMEPLRDSETFISLMTTFANPLLGIIAGAVFTAIIQSSSASVGILQALAAGGLIPFSSAVFVLFGMNIGTCITAVLAAIGTNRAAKRTTIIHLMFNIIGTCIFTVVCLVSPLEDMIGSITPGNPAAQIANMHTTFNLVTTILLIPFGNYMAKAAMKLLPDLEVNGRVSLLKAMEEEFTTGLSNFGSSAMHMDILDQEIKSMVKLAGQNAYRCYQAILESDDSYLEEIEETEKEIDMMNKDISQFISKILVHDHSGENVAAIEEYFLITGNAERIGDHAANIGGYINVIKDKKIVFSEKAQFELCQMQAITRQTLDKVLEREGDVEEWLCKIASLEQQIDDMTLKYRDSHLKRMREGKCSAEACILFSELLTDFERIGDHLLNIGQSYAKIG